MDLSTASGGPDLYSYTLASDRVPAGQVSQILGGSYTFQVQGTLNGATVTLQLRTQSSNGTFGSTISTSSTPFSAPFAIFPWNRAEVRVIVSGGTPTNLVAVLNAMGY